jgi:hypothetical protein
MILPDDPASIAVANVGDLYDTIEAAIPDGNQAALGHFRELGRDSGHWK